MIEEYWNMCCSRVQSPRKRKAREVASAAGNPLDEPHSLGELSDPDLVDATDESAPPEPIEPEPDPAVLAQQ